MNTRLNALQAVDQVLEGEANPYPTRSVFDYLNPSPTEVSLK
jgi:hypothetical protein